MALQPKTKEIVFSAMHMAIDKSGGIAEAAHSFGLNLDRFKAVIDGKVDVPPQWVEAFIAFGDGRVGANGFKVMRNRALALMECAAPRQHSDRLLARRLAAKCKLIRVFGQLRLLDPSHSLPEGAVFVHNINNKSVYLEGKLKEKFLNTPMCEVKLLCGAAKRLAAS